MSDDTAAFLQQREDAGPLAGLLEALRASLDRICQAVRRQAQGLGNENVVLQGAVFSLLQDGNALARLGLHGPDRMLQALAHLARQFIVRPETCTLQAAASLERASDALLEHLGACVHGRQPPDVALFPQYRELQTLRGEARIHPADLWRAPEPWAWRAADLPDRLPESGLAVVPYYYGAALRLRMDAAVLQMIKNSDSAAAYNLRDMALGLAWGESREEARVFWQIAAAYFEALALNYLSADLYAKRTASRVLLQYGALSRAAANKEGEGESEESGATSADIVSEQLAKDLLFFCAQAAPDEGAAPILAAVRAAYDLTLSQGVNYELPRYGRFDPLVLAQTRQRIRAVAETWPKLAAGDASLILEAGEQFGQLGVSLLTLQPEQRELARALLQAMDLTVRKNQPPAEPLATEVAAAILFLEAAYDDLDPTQDIFKLSCSEQLAERIDRAVEIAEGDADTAAELPAAPAWLELLHERVRERREQMAAAAIAAEEAAAEPAPAEAEAMQEEASPPAEAAEADAEPRREPEFAPGQEAMAEAERASESEPEDETEPGRSFASSGFHLELTPDEAFDDADQFKVIGPLQIPIPDYNVFLNETDGWSRQLQTELSEWSLELHRPLPVTCIALTHSLTASAASVGFDELAALARSLALAMLKVRARQQGDAEDARIFTLAADNIRYLLHQFAAGFLKSPEPGLIEELQLISGPDVDTPPAWFEDPQNASLPAESLDDPQDERLAQAQAVRNIAYEGYDDADLFGTEEGESTTELDFRDSEPGETIGGDALDTEGFAGFEALAASALPQLADTLRLWAEQPEDEGARLQALDLLGDLSEAAGQVGAHEWSNQAQQLLLAIEQLGSDGADSGGEWGYAAVSAAQIEPLLLRQADLQQAFDELKMRWAEGGASFDMSADTDAGPESEFDMALDVPPPSRGTSAEAMAQGVSPAMIEKIGQQAGELLQTRGRIEERLDLVHGGLRELDVRLEHLRNVLRQAGVPPETIKELSLVQSHLQEALGEVEEELVAQIQQTMDLQDSLNGLQSDNPHNPDRHGG